MPLSVFNHYVAGFPEAGETLIHNTFTGAYVVLEDQLVEALRKADRGELLTGAERALIDDPDLADPDVGVVVASLEQEEAEFQAWFERRRHRPTLDCMVGINLACNFDCPYCSQAQVMSGKVMSPETCDQTAAWLAKRALDTEVEKVFLALVGGEPLLHPDRIERLVRGVRERVGDGVEVQFALITNGYFLDAAMVDRLVPIGLTQAQVTIDGDETTHCKTRVSKKGEDTYRRIFDNVIAASRKIRITVNGNYQTDTVHSFENLIHQLAAAGLPMGSKITFSPALEGLSSAEGVGSGSCTWSGSDTSMQVAFHDAILAYNFQTNPVQVFGPCELHDSNSFAIEPDGTIHTCPGFLGHPDWGIGHVAEGLNEERYRHFLGLTPKSNPCGGCSHRPNCGGGCLAAEWLRAGSTDGVNCEKGYFESMKEAGAIRGYLLATSDSLAEALEQFPDAPRPPSTARRSTSLRVIAA